MRLLPAITRALMSTPQAQLHPVFNVPLEIFEDSSSSTSSSSTLQPVIIAVCVHLHFDILPVNAFKTDASVGPSSRAY